MLSLVAKIFEYKSTLGEFWGWIRHWVRGSSSFGYLFLAWSAVYATRWYCTVSLSNHRIKYAYAARATYYVRP
jgi:hypothetical protein